MEVSKLEHALGNRKFRFTLNMFRRFRVSNLRMNISTPDIPYSNVGKLESEKSFTSSYKLRRRRLTPPPLGLVPRTRAIEDRGGQKISPSPRNGITRDVPRDYLDERTRRATEWRRHHALAKGRSVRRGRQTQGVGWVAHEVDEGTEKSGRRRRDRRRRLGANPWPRAAVLILSPDMRNARRFNKLPGLMKHVRVIHGRLIESYL